MNKIYSYDIYTGANCYFFVMAKTFFAENLTKCDGYCIMLNVKHERDDFIIMKSRIIFTVISLISAVLFGVFFIGGISDVWIIPAAFCGTYLALGILFWAVIILSCLFINPNKVYDKPSKFYEKMFAVIYDGVIRLFRIHLHTSGTKMLPEGCYLLVSNHRSNFDNMVECAAAGGRNIAYISKPSNFRIPIGRRFMRRCCYLEIDRENPKNAFRTVERAVDFIKTETCPVGLFPEGHRTRCIQMDEFKHGCFLIAEKAACPVVVCCVRGTEKIHKNFPLRHTDVYVDILSVIPKERVCGRRAIDVSNEARQLIADFLNEKGEIQNDTSALQSAGKQ